MKRVVKKYLIPHEDNDYKPHLLRKGASIFLLTLVAVIELILLSRLYIIHPGANFLASILPNVLIDLTNGDRNSDALPSLRVNDLLEDAARLKAQDMASKGYFSHVNPEGLTPWYWFQKVGYTYDAAGENLAVNFSDSEDVVRAWMNSEGHRKNILNQKFTDIGIGIASGAYKGRQTIFIVQLFGKPSALAAAVVPAVKPLMKAAPPQETTAPPQTAPVAENNVKSAEMFVENVNEPTTNVAAVSSENTAAPAAVVSVPKESTFFMRFATMPKAYTAYVYFGLLALMSLAIALKVFVKIRIQHPVLIVNGLIVIFVILSFIAINKYLLVTSLQIF